MKKNVMIILIFSLLTAFASTETAPKEVVDFVNTELLALGSDPIIIEAVIAENAKGKSLAEIQSADEKWKNTAGIDAFMETLLSSDCAVHLQQIQEKYGFISEIFVMDNQGANVAMTDKTSDYWQGDEAKFQKSFNSGAGAVFIDEVEFDDSTQTYSVQASLPVKSGGKVIGAITIGIDLDAFES